MALLATQLVARRLHVKEDTYKRKASVILLFIVLTAKVRETKLSANLSLKFRWVMGRCEFTRETLEGNV